MATLKIAIIGGGVSGLSAAWHLSPHAKVTVFETQSYLGGHANTVDIRVNGKVFGVDTGFLVFNPKTYPQFAPFLNDLQVHTSPADMGFSVQVKGQDQSTDIEWAGNNLNAVFNQRKNLLNPRFWGMLAGILRFNRAAKAYASKPPSTTQALGEYLQLHGYSQAFRDWYLVPMAASIWSCPTATMMSYPMATFTQFCDNHGLLQITARPQWFTVTNGSRCYVQAMAKRLTDVRLNSAVTKVVRTKECVTITTEKGSETFDAVVMANHSDEIVKLLADDISEQEKAVLSAVSYQMNTAVLHTDASVLPTHKRAWAAWNYQTHNQGLDTQSVCLHYLINKLQPLPVGEEHPVIVTLNPLPSHPPRADTVIRQFSYAHPVFNTQAIAAQHLVPALQGVQRTWFAGAWTRYGFHEDGFVSGKTAAAHVLNSFGIAP